MQQTMKPTLILLPIFVVIFSCQKEDNSTCMDGVLNQGEAYIDCGGPCTPCPITYPEQGNNGSNLLYGAHDTLFLIPSNYSLKADVPTGSSFKVTLNWVSGDYWFYGTNNGWNVGSLSESQTFEVANPGTANLILNLSNGSGVASLDYHENGDQVTFSKVLVWD